jgi:hypothetical protein
MAPKYLASKPAFERKKKGGLGQFGEAQVDHTSQVPTHEKDDNDLDRGDERAEDSFNDQVGEPVRNGRVEGSVEFLKVKFTVLEELRDGSDRDVDGEETKGRGERKTVTNALNVVLKLRGEKAKWSRKPIENVRFRSSKQPSRKTIHVEEETTEKERQAGEHE